MKKSAISLILILFSLFFLAVSDVQSQQMYKWTDENGVVHFSDTPPEKGKAEVTDIPDNPPPTNSDTVAEAAETAAADGTEALQTTSAAQQRREKIAENRAKADAEQAIRDAECAVKRSEVAQLEPHRRVYYQNAEGETVRMDDQARADRVAESKKFIQENCN